MTHVFAFCTFVQLLVCYWISSKFKEWVHALTVCFPVGMARPGQDQPCPCSLPFACQFSTARRHGVTSQRGTKVKSPVEELEPGSLALQWHIPAHRARQNPKAIDEVSRFALRAAVDSCCCWASATDTQLPPFCLLIMILSCKLPARLSQYFFSRAVRNF